jgi:PAS domain S-box-containing protein
MSDALHESPVVSPPPARRTTTTAQRHTAKQVPSGREVTFGLEEIIVSKTDPTGNLTYCNDVFIKVSGYTEAELLGQPHSLVRHPDMPRCVFKVLWQTIEAGQEIFAYVLNMSKAGDGYWVFAHVTPTFDEDEQIVGYHSNRRCPDRSQIEAIAPIYQALLAEERLHEGKAAQIAASTVMLRQMLRERHLTWEQFVFSLR